MDFREEYKKQAEVMTPSAEAMERMTAKIMEQVNAPVKKAIPFKRIAYIGGTVAACAVIAVGAVRLLPAMDNTLETAAEDYATVQPSATYIEQACVAEAENSAFDVLTDATENAVDADVYLKQTDSDAADNVNDAYDSNAAANADKSFADMSVPDEVVDHAGVAEDAVDTVAGTAHEYVMEEAVPSIEKEHDASVPTPECPTELIYVAEDKQSFTIGGTEYLRLPSEIAADIALTDECSVSSYIGADGEHYDVADFGVAVILVHNVDDSHGEYCGIYSTADNYDIIISSEN